MDDTWFFLNETVALGQTPSAKISAGYYKGPVTLTNHVNKGLNSMGTDKARAKLSYISITQKITLHMTPGTEFTILHHSTVGTILGFLPSVVSTPPADARTYVHPSLFGTVVGQPGFDAQKDS